jgi:hypothetical protein
LLAAVIALLSGLIPASARDITLVTWNLGWHMSLAEADAWIAACGQPFVLNTGTGLWEPSGGPPLPDAKPGWELKWGRDARIAWDIGKMAPCDIYQANFKIVPVTGAAYRKRMTQIRSMISGVLDADALAFQEVTGEASVREVLPGNGAGYSLCSFSSHTIQRLVIAWKNSLGKGVECEVEDALSLPGEPNDKRPRPGLSVVQFVRTCPQQERLHGVQSGRPGLLLKMSCKERERDIANGPQAIVAANGKPDMQRVTVVGIWRCALHLAVENDEVFAFRRGVCVWLSFVLVVWPHGQQRIDRFKLISDDCRQRREALIVGVTIDAVVHATPAKHGGEHMLAGAGALSANDAGSCHPCPSQAPSATPWMIR